MPTTATIIPFPKKNIRHDDSGPVQTEDDIITRVEAVHQLHIDNVLMAIMENVCNSLIVGGFDCEVEQSHYFAVATESIRALMDEQYDLWHPFQDIAEKLLEQDEDGVWSPKENITISKKRVRKKKEVIT